jgi:hypothetical protein
LYLLTLSNSIRMTRAVLLILSIAIVSIYGKYTVQVTVSFVSTLCFLLDVTTRSALSLRYGTGWAIANAESTNKSTTKPSAATSDSYPSVKISSSDRTTRKPAPKTRGSTVPPTQGRKLSRTGTLAATLSNNYTYLL